jgi:hydrogenase maturation protein HypF
MERRSVAVSGIVQGVGFRPFIHGLAIRLGLNGFVRNRAGDVLIELEGEPHSLDRFINELMTQPPPLARIDAVKCVAGLPRGDQQFRIEPSDVDCAGPIFIASDIATCDDCLREMFDAKDRRYRYPFLNCTNCGPRLTIIRGMPYDRERTTMATFAMCDACRAEFGDPSDRRYHAQPIACPACGPRLQALDGHGQAIDLAQPLVHAVEALKQGRIVAIKSLGGYHLACSAEDDRAVSELRWRKHRGEKPLALMVRDLRAASEICELSPDELEILTSPRRPIVLLRRRESDKVADAVAPGNPFLGVMLPYTPLHHLLMEDLSGIPLVMTSGNRSDEPIAFDDADALDRLSAIADMFLTNNRAIHLRCDDSVTRLVNGVELPLRRSRGDAPMPLPLPVPCPRPTLALGGQLKATFALGRGRHAFVSHHMGDLDNYEAYRAYVAAIGHYGQLFAFRPELLVHDLHPDYSSTRYAAQLGESIPRLAVQHHHAHMASCMADNGLDEPVIGVTFDGTGFGIDGAIWGGEFLTGDYRGFRRAAHLRYVAMPGGDQAIREPWRMALTHLIDAGLSDGTLHNRIPATTLTTARRMIERQFNAPLTSSMGRLFDGVAALAALRDRVSYEGQAAIELEWMAAGCNASGAYPFEIEEPASSDSPLLIDTRPLICGVAESVRMGEKAANISRMFHSSVVEIVATVCSRLQDRSGLSVVVLSGGVFLNALLTGEVLDRLERDGFRVYRHQCVPPGDGGLSLGQLAVAAASDGTVTDPGSWVVGLERGVADVPRNSREGH